MGVHDDLHRLIDRAMGSDAPTAVAAIRQLTDEHLPWLERRAVALARREEVSWARLARMLGISRQAVHQRYGHLVSVDSAALPQIPRHEDELLAAAAHRVIAEAVRDRRQRQSLTEDDPPAW